MKSTKMLLTIALLTSVMAFAQKREHRGERGKYHQDLTLEQLVTLKTKKMTLALELTKKQQKQIFEFNLANAEFRKEKMAERKSKKASGELTRPSTEERFEMENARLDRMIAQQEELKEILTEGQYDQWKKMQLHKYANVKKNRHSRARRG